MIRRRVERLPLRVVLVGTMLLLVLAGLVASGAAVTTTMRAQLVDRVDDQLVAAAGGWADRPEGPRSAPVDQSPGSESRRSPGRPSRGSPPSRFYVEERTVSGEQVLSVGDSDGRPEVPENTVLGTPVTVDGTNGERWRVLALPSREGVTILGMPLDREVEHTITLLIVVSAVVGAVVLLVVGAAGWVLVTRAFRPLDEVRAAAGQIAAGDLDRRLPPRPRGTEVGDLTASLDEMVAALQGALAASGRAEAAARESEAGARASEERTRRFAADAGHELRTPLTSIRGFAELYRMGALPDPETALSRIEDESLRMTRIVEDLLTLAHLDAERPLDTAPVDLAELVTRAVESVRATAPGRDLRLTVSAVPVVTGDAGRLRQVVTNLVVNALRHTPDGTTVEVTVGVEARGAEERGAGGTAVPGTGGGETGAEDAVVVVRDDGPGMRPEDAARAFERFHRADTSRTRGEGGGSGLGLSIVDELVRAHGGSVTLDTAPGAGATFTVRLPAN